MGGALLRFGARLARGRAPGTTSTLWVFLRNAQARAFYARSGFRLDGAKSTHDASGVATARMRRAMV